jgi:CHAD domain-containing protein
MLSALEPFRLSRVFHRWVMKSVVWQFDALDLRPVARWLDARRSAPPAAPGAAVISAAGLNGFPFVAFESGASYDVEDTFVDTPDWRFHRAGLSLRIRDTQAGHEAQLNRLDPNGNGDGPEPAPQTSLASGEAAGLTEEPGRVGEWVRALSGRQSPVPLFRLKSTRHPYSVLIDGKAGEVVLDETCVERPSGTEAVRLHRVQIQIDPGSADAVRPFVDDLRRACRLTPSVATKFEAGLMTLDLIPARLPDVGPLVLGSDPTMGQLAFAVLRRAFLSMLQNEAGTRIGEDPEALHDMRVAIRRTRAAMALLEPALPIRARTLRGELRWIARKLGGVRDLDIQSARLETWRRGARGPDAESLAQLQAAVAERRRNARAAMLRALDTRRYERLVSRMVRMLRQGPPRRSPAARAPALAAFPGLVLERHAGTMAAGDSLDADSPAEAFHRLRIRLKRLRYAVENSRDLYGSAASDYVNVLVRLQDLLGDHQDSVVAIAQIHGLLGSGRRRLPPETVFMMGRISERYQQTAARLRKRYRKTFQPFNGKAWTRLQKAMDKGLASRSKVAWPPQPRTKPVPPPPKEP